MYPKPKMARILLIDDEEMVRLTVGAALRFSGHEVAVAQDGEEGINLFQSEPFDLVVTDMRLPGLNGPEVIKALRALRPEIGVIGIGGGGSVPAFGPEVFAKKIGADRVLAKPFAVQELNTAVAEVLKIAKAG
jgi:DNA-binding NtrC family response regulator